jgi:CMP-N,N'-diacetyllegionaminic acid synthase
MKSKTRILGVTLARSGSKGVPGKHLRMLGRKPLLDYTLDLVNEISLLDYYVVSTDSKTIQNHVISKGLQAPFLRPKSLSTDDASSVSALQHAITYMETSLNINFTHIVEIMATNPFKESIDINSCIDELISKDLDAVIAVHRVFDHHPSRLKKIVDGMLVDFCVPETPESRRQDLMPPSYVRSGAIYALTREMIMDKGLRYGTNRCAAYELAGSKAINIDSEIDFLTAEILLNRQDDV